MNKMKYLLGLALLSLSTNSVMAHEPDFFRSTGKIYGTYAVVLILFIVLILYLYSLDRKMTRLEKSIDDE